MHTFFACLLSCHHHLPICPCQVRPAFTSKQNFFSCSSMFQLFFLFCKYKPVAASKCKCISHSAQYSSLLSANTTCLVMLTLSCLLCVPPGLPTNVSCLHYLLVQQYAYSCPSNLSNQLLLDLPKIAVDQSELCAALLLRLAVQNQNMHLPSYFFTQAN